MKQLFQNKYSQDFFDKHGYVVMPLLSKEQIDKLLDLYNNQIKSKDISGLYESSRHNTYEVNRLINESIYNEIKQSSENIFEPSKLYGGTFMVKSPQNSEVLPLHQDWSVVEEDKYNTIFIWCPLINVSSVNGGLFVLEGSHKYFKCIRSGSYSSNRYVLPLQLNQFIKNISLKAGEAIFYSDKLFHGSHSNNTQQDRIVVTARVMEQDAQLVYFHKADEKHTDVYAVDSKFYLTHIDSIAKGNMPPGIEKLYTRAYSHTVITDNSLQEKIWQHYASHKNTNMNYQLFKDAELQAAFDKDGYVVIDLINADQVKTLLSFYNNLEKESVPGYGFKVSLDSKNPDFVRKVSGKLISEVEQNVNNYFKDHQIFTASFVVKEKNPLGFVPPHQDWTFADENKYWTATIWCTLVDVNAENGGLGVLKGSHLFYDHVRPSPSPQYEPPFKNQIPEIFPYMKIIELKAGQALVFNNKTIHGSPPNLTDNTRVSFGIGITHKNASIQHYYKLPKEQNLIEGFEVNKDFFFNYNNARLSVFYEKGEKPTGLNSIGVFSYACKNYTSNELIERIKEAGNVMDTSLINIAKPFLACTSHGKINFKNTADASAEKNPMQTRSFWQTYTPSNIFKEIKHRLIKK